MKITNMTGLPDPVFNAITRNNYLRGDADRTVTELIDSPRVVALKAAHMDREEIVRDVSEMVPSFIGNALHAYLEDNGDVYEERLYASVDDWRISGQIDLQTIGDSVDVVDWKCTSVWTVIYNGRGPSWERQLNVYEWLREKNGRPPAGSLSVVAFMRDWQRAKKDDHNYPSASIVRIPIRMWTPDEREAYVRQRVAMHKEASEALLSGSELPPCSDEDRWAKPCKFAVKKHGSKRAMKLFDTQEEAERFATMQRVHVAIETRPAVYMRCKENYCGVADFCSQWQAIKEEQAYVTSTSTNDIVSEDGE